MGQKTDKILKRAKVNLKDENHENALRLLNEVLNREPRNKEALRSKALIKILNGTPKEAEGFLLFAIEQQPEDDQLYQMLGTFYHNNENHKKALEFLRKAVAFNEENAMAHQGLGMLYARIFGEHEKAAAHFTKTIELGKESKEIYFSRGCSYMLIDEMGKAEQDLLKAYDRGHEKANEMLKKYF